MYKDKEAQKEANRLASQRRRAKNRDSAILPEKQRLENAPGLTRMDDASHTHSVIPCESHTLTVTPSVIPTGDRKFYINELSNIDSNEPKTEPQRQHYIHKRNSETRARLRATSLCTLKAERQWIPVWREAQA